MLVLCKRYAILKKIHKIFVLPISFFAGTWSLFTDDAQMILKSKVFDHHELQFTVNMGGRLYAFDLMAHTMTDVLNPSKIALLQVMNPR